MVHSYKCCAYKIIKLELCFDGAQVVEVNALELELHLLLSERLEALLSRRRRSVRDQAEGLQRLTCEPHLPPPVC